ncbi:hypothetical protein ID866_4376 [Astraeus odoratus]|nr:hypothetical protein ID866_4376 [Astraeus odoratus]
MGISGLLTLLKSIQVTKHLSDFSGQTLAVDAYVWLHRGIYTCATELATGKNTQKYVDYAMQRIRLLRHHKIQPYVVFDGGPLPAKRGTESERKQRREENFAKAKALTAQGKHSQAREFYAKCVDVTPQMAYQLIKALRAEGIQYVVAPYEADAQMAYLERIGLVDGIITEDSDLLVFGCRKVLFKFDFASSTVACISRTDFGSVTAAEGGISLAGWTDDQFRAMAILSGCDYLPSIPGIGLKTAWSLLRKHRSVDQVVRTLKLEGKKPVPKGYLEAFRQAEKVFLHQRVYCPLEEKLVKLTEVATDLHNIETEAYIGRDLDPSLAMGVAQGEIDPVTLLIMVDINPSFVPRVLKALPLQYNAIDRSRPVTDKAKGRAKADCGSGTLLTFFSSNPSLKLYRSNSAPTKRAIPTAGKNSGKRSLADLLDDNPAEKRMRMECSREAGSGRRSTSFALSTGTKERRPSTSSTLSGLLSGPSCRRQAQACAQENLSKQKENTNPCDNLEGKLDDGPDLVNQEDGYMSPTPSYFRSATPDLSSPVRPPHEGTQRVLTAMDDFGADIVSSPVAKLSTRRDDDGAEGSLATTPVHGLVRSTPSPNRSDEMHGPDLRDILTITTPSQDEEDEDADTSTPSTWAPVTPEDPYADEVWVDEDFGIEARVQESRAEIVANGWWNKWALNKEPRTATVSRLSTNSTI